IAVVEDAAHGIGASYKGRALGTIGSLGCYSFHATKNIVSGEGGALLLNHNQPQLIERAEIIYEKGTDRSQFLRGEVDRYTWHEIGSSFVMADLLAAFLYAQLERLEEITQARQQRFFNYQQAFLACQQREILQLPCLPAYAQSNYHLFFMLCPTQEMRDQMLQNLRDRGVEASFHFIPLHSAPMGRKLGYNNDDLSITEDISRRLIRLPLYPDLSETEQSYVIESVQACVAGW
ncbi:MAG TPA: DegT/DnrJ/EryC1/StrS family aminotransferase, partial [Syntrophomonas sp.]|nr:DegT/DnrJ/EryC1/StrS family aminotransferase [Syntrophomonas sp.]